MPKPSRNALWLSFAALLMTLATVGYFMGRAILWGGKGPAAPDRFEAIVPTMAFVDRTAAAGFNHIHLKPNLDPQLTPIMSWVASVGAAAAAADFDADGWMDLYVTSSRKQAPNRLYRNQGDGTFLDVAPAAGVAEVNNETGTSMDCVWADYDNDGDPDLYIVKWGRDVLFRNNGDGTFEDVTAELFHDEKGEPGSPWANGCGAIWVDYDGDGWLDLYVANYFAPHDLWHLDHTRIMHDSFETARNAGPNFMFHSERGTGFTEVAAALGLDDTGWTLSVGHGDINNDGWPDIYSADDFGPDQIFLNTGQGTFLNVTAATIGPDTKKGMNVDFGDFDGNGWLDIYVTNITTAEYLREGNMLWHNDAADENGVPVFMDISVESAVYDGGWGWGAKFFDYDNDADLDIIALNGFISAGEGNYWYDLASWTVMGENVTDALKWPPIGNRSFSGSEATRLWQNEGNLRFTEIAQQSAIDSHGDGRGVVVFDYDNDGDLDVYIANQGQPPGFFENQIGEEHHWLGIRLIGRPAAGSNRDAIGARVTVVTANGRQIRELDGGNSFCGQSDRRVFFGLGDDEHIATLEIRWPSRRIQVLRNVPVDRIMTIEEPVDLPVVASLIPTTRGPGSYSIARRTPNSAPPPAKAQALLSRYEARIHQRLEDLTLSSQYRRECIRLGEHDRSVRFFEKLAEEFPAVRGVRLQLAAAYVDKIPTRGGVAAVVSKGTLARQSLDQIDMLVDADNSWWPAYYTRAMNHLHWPQALRHTDDAIRDFRHCLALQAQDDQPHSYYVRTYLGLGDALAKKGEFDEALNTWREGLRIFPGNAELMTRVALADGKAASDFVKKHRNLENQIDTDFSFLNRR